MPTQDVAAKEAGHHDGHLLEGPCLVLRLLLRDHDHMGSWAVVGFAVEGLGFRVTRDPKGPCTWALKHFLYKDFTGPNL